MPSGSCQRLCVKECTAVDKILVIIKTSVCEEFTFMNGIRPFYDVCLHMFLLSHEREERGLTCDRHAL